MQTVAFASVNWKLCLFAAVVALVSYLLGSVSFAVIVSRIGAKDDVRNHGSGNAGMTNILRSYGKKMAAFTAIGDFGKGVIAVALGRIIFSLAGIQGIDAGYIAGLFVILGHLYPLFFGFKGGKGVLTSLGAAVIVSPIPFLVIAGIAIPTVFAVKIVSLISVIGFALYPFVVVAVDLLLDKPLWGELLFSLIVSSLGIWKHRSNIQRLRAGTEYKFGQNNKR
ncbi:glycerol-3-phosphate 1-O-acyltransferase [Anaerotruncus sp. X29]|uniref:glycerol-3-phosphate 1-O-acyltransferase PlsY n=1 Tax=Anaerotruncus sp. G3(2012) TaxID=1235835 RepID=UPI000335C420|nr:glycerol-3-phosphate 1-O-acyltransferase PlsY [Anaerotruncus sp. G3(2012)]EOS58234.1 acyl-phosphate glycerol 3-phosphate acyltransferase [Anaerotruncus sp. G3(2012)]NCE76396.1 glycerol-3-phosphate 1-O-acyltransferase [Anaerotruncus sp. X29]